MERSRLSEAKARVGARFSLSSQLTCSVTRVRPSTASTWGGAYSGGMAEGRGGERVHVRAATFEERNAVVSRVLPRSNPSWLSHLGTRPHPLSISMSDSEDEDLAALRAARAARLGAAGLTVVSSMRRVRVVPLARWPEENACMLSHPLSPSLSQTAARRAAAADRGEGCDDDDGGRGGGDATDLRSHFPAGFGGAAGFDLPQSDEDEEGDASDGAAAAAAARDLKRGREDEGEDEDTAAGSEEEEEDADADDPSNPFALPLSHEASLPPTPRGVCALALDRPGARLLAGSRDGTLQIFAFGTMDAGLAPRRTLTPRADHPVTALAWAPSASAFLAATADPCLLFFDPDGRKVGETVRGDPYLRDAKHTAGHTAPVTAAAWHPANPGTAASASEDGTVRLWNTETAKQATVIKPTHARTGPGVQRVGVSALTYAGEGGELLAAGCEDGSLHWWDLRAGGASAAIGGLVPPPREQMALRPDWRVVGQGSGGAAVERVATGAHAPDDGGCAVTALAPDATRGGGGALRLASRGGDGTLKVWDLRSLGPQGDAAARRGGSAPAPAPLLSVGDLPAEVAGTGAAWSPDGRVVAAAVSATGGAASGGSLVFADAAAAGSAIIRRLALPPPASAIALAWHRGINQVFVGTGSARAGGVRVFYSPASSIRGVAAAGRRPKRKPDPADWTAPLVIHAPHALAAFRGDVAIPGLPKPRVRRGAPSREPTKAGPAPPAGAGGGRAAPTRPARTLLTQQLLAGGGALRPAGAEADVREALLAHGQGDEGGGGGPRVLADTEEEEG